MAESQLWPFIVCLIITTGVESTVAIGGSIAEDTTFTLFQSPIVVTSDLMIEENATLTIDPGVDLQLQTGVGIFIQGVLLANGTATQGITFTAYRGSIPENEKWWYGIEWLPGARNVVQQTGGVQIKTSSSVFRFVDVKMAGQSRNNGNIATNPAISVSGVSPVFDNVNVTDCFGDGLRLTDILNEARVMNSIVYGNGGSGISVSTIGPGRLYVNDVDVTDNMGNGIDFDWNRQPVDSALYDFCSFNRSIEESVYLELDLSFPVDPNECVQILRSPPGTTLMAYLVAATGSSNSRIQIYEGDGTANPLATLIPNSNSVNGELITTSVSSMHVRAWRLSISYRIAFTMFVAVRRNADYDIQLSSSLIARNADHGVRIGSSQREVAITDCVVSNNGVDGIHIVRLDDQFVLTSTNVDHNEGSGLNSPQLYGQARINACSFRNNSFDGINVLSQSLYVVSNFIHSVSITDTSVLDHGDTGINFRRGSPCFANVHEFHLSASYVRRNVEGGFNLRNDCPFNTGIDIAVSITESTFSENGNKILVLDGIQDIDMRSNVLANNTGIELFQWRLYRFASGNQDIFRDNSFVNNTVDIVMKIDGGRCNTMNPILIENNTFIDNTCRNVLNLQWEPSGAFRETDTLEITKNEFKSNTPAHYHHHYWMPPAVIVSFDKPYISFSRNLMENHLFPFQLNAQGDNFDTVTMAAYNWWGTVNDTEIQHSIIDQHDKYEYPRVEYFPYLQSASVVDVINDDVNRTRLPFFRGDIIGGVISEDITIEKRTEPYIVDRDIFIQKSATLHIQPGTTLRFAYHSAIFAQGTLNATGTSTEKITFESQNQTDIQIQSGSSFVLVDGNDPWEGRLEVIVEDDRYTICDRDWTFNNAHVVCRELGFSGAVRYYRGYGQRNPYPGAPYDYFYSWYDYDRYDYVEADYDIGMWNQTFDCTGNEINSMQCSQRVLTETCISHASDINIECVSPQWAGILFPADSDISMLQHVVIRDSGFKLRSYDWRATNSIGLFIHRYHHLLEDIDIISPASTGMMIYPDPFQPNYVLNSISIKHCKNSGHSVQFYQLGIEIRNLHVTSCSGVYYNGFPSSTIGRNIAKYMRYQNRVNDCVENIVLNPGDVRIIAPLSGTSCDLSASTIHSAGRIGVFVIYSYYYTIRLGETEQTINNDISYLDTDNVLSETNSFSIRYHALRSSGSLYMLVTAVIDPVTMAPYMRQFSLVNCAFSNIINNQDAVRIYPDRDRLTSTQFVVRDSWFSGNRISIRLSALYGDHVEIYSNTFYNNSDNTIYVYRSDELARLSISYNEFNSNYGTVLRIPNDFSECNITNNIFWNNSSPYVVEFYKAVDLSSATTDNLDHQFLENILSDNQPMDTTSNMGLTCTVLTNVDKATFKNNRFDNDAYEYELCFGAFLSFNTQGSVDATYNNWNANNDSGVKRRLFDFDDWNDRPIVTFRPYLVYSTDETEIIASNNGGILPSETKFTGGRIFQDYTLIVDESPYYIESDITVLENVTLTIGAGVEIIFQANVGILVLGQLIAVGDHNDRIVLRSLEPTIIEDDSIRLLDDGSSLYRGTLQILIQDEWEAICIDTSSDYYWYHNDYSIRRLGMVACRQLQYDQFVSYYYVSREPSMVSPEYVQCSGNESTVAECPRQEIDNSNCYYVVGLQCQSSVSSKYNGYWGGIRIVGNIENPLQSVLDNVEIIHAGYLHAHQIPALSIRHASPCLNNVTITKSPRDGISIDTAIADFKMENVTVRGSGGTGVVMYHMDNTHLEFRNVTSNDNLEAGMTTKTHNFESIDICQLGYYPICINAADESIVVDTFAVITFPFHIPFVYDSTPNKLCSVLITPKPRTTLVISIFRQRYRYHDDSITVIDEMTGSVLQSIPTRSNVRDLMVVSQIPGNSVRVTMNYRYRRYEEVYIHVLSSPNDDVSHSIKDSAFENNQNGGGISLDNHLSASTNTSVQIERCKVTSNSARTQQEYAIAIQKARGGQLDIRNCQITDNNMIGGIFVSISPSIGLESLPRDVMNSIVENVIAINSGSGGMIVIDNSSPDIDTPEHFQIDGNLIQHNSPLDSKSVIDLNGVYVDLNTNVLYNNTGGRSIKIRQDNLQKLPQECINNLIYYNVGMEINRRITIENAANGLQYRDNTIHNSANTYEIEAVTGGDVSDDGADILIATRNWWGPGSPQNRFRDSVSVAGYAEVVFDPSLDESIQDRNCPTGYSWHQNSRSCYIYKGGVLNLEDAKRSCKVDGASLPETDYGKIPFYNQYGLLEVYNRYATFDDSSELVWVTQPDGIITLGMSTVDKEACTVMDVTKLMHPFDKSMYDTACDARYPYICIRKYFGSCRWNCMGNGVCTGSKCNCNAGWSGAYCDKYDCNDVNQCSGFGDCVGPNLCRCRGGWQGRACSVSYCSRYDRCKTCARITGCGWCDTTQSCLPGTAFSPDKEDCVNWFYYGCFTPGTCSNTIDKLRCDYRQCEERAIDTDNESCQRCLDVQRCFSSRQIGECETWDENKCPSGIVSVDYADHNRLMKAELFDDVKILDNDDVILYRCPVCGDGPQDEHELFISSQIVDVVEGDIIATEQAGGIVHRVAVSVNQDRHTLMLGRQADISEAVKYADFSQPAPDIEIIDNSNMEDNTPDQALLEDLSSGQLPTNGNSYQLFSDSIPYKCRGQKYINSEAPGSLLTSTFIVLPNNDDTSSYAVDDILVSVNGSVNIESVKEIVVENDAVFVHTDLVECDRDTIFSEYTNVSSSNLTNDGIIDMSCAGGLGRSNLLILNTDVTTDDLDFIETDNVAIESGSFVGKIIFKMEVDDVIVIEVVTVQTALELESLPPSDKLLNSPRNRPDSITGSATTFHFHDQFSENHNNLNCSGEVEFRYSPKMTYTLESSRLSGVDSIGIGLNGNKDSSIRLKCQLENGTDNVNVGFGQKNLGYFKFLIGSMPIVGSFHGMANLQISSQSTTRAGTEYTENTTCSGETAMIWRQNTGMSFYNRDPKCLTTTYAEVDLDEQAVDPVLVSATHSVSISVVVPAHSKPICPSTHTHLLPSWLKPAIGVNINTICTKSRTQRGASFTEFITFKGTVNGNTCDKDCPDPSSSLLVSGKAGLDGLKLTGSYKTDDLNDVQVYHVSNGYQGIRYKQCMSTSYECCSCPDQTAGKRDDSGECLCECLCDPSNMNSIMKKEVCQCNLCPDGVTLEIDSKCTCFCEDGTQQEMESDGTCPCPSFCECDDCSISTLGQRGCECQNTCPPCGPDETQVWENCECTCRLHNDCGIPPTCVLGRKGSSCEELDCFPCHTCSGNGVCTVSGQCTSTCRCNRQWSGECCDQRIPRNMWGDPHIDTLDGVSFDYYGIGEYVFCQSPVNDFGIHTRFFAFKQASLIGAVAVKALSHVVTITTPGTTPESLPNLRIDGDLKDIKNTSSYMLGNSTVKLDIQRPSANNATGGLAVAILSFQYQSGPVLTVEVRYSTVMQRQYINMLFGPTIDFFKKTEGLCGYMDDDDTNDFRGPDDTLYEDLVIFAESWRVTTSQVEPGTYGSWSWTDSNFHRDDIIDISYTDPDFVPVYTTDALSPADLEIAISLCTALGISDSLLDGCIYDIAVTNDTSFGEQESLKLGCPSQCSGKGSCVKNTCECLQGWSGDDCSTGACGECSRGSCVAGFCMCDIGWEGPKCDMKATCFGVNNCTDETHGQCKITDTCLCSLGFTGDDCSLVATCHNVFDCSDHGKCKDFDVCLCDYGWNGTSCDRPSCETHSSCSGNGECITYDKCKCYPGWKTSSCGIPDCDGVDNCSGNGDCVARDTCECYGGFVGSNCSQLLNCSHLDECSGQGLCVIEPLSEEINCRCYIGYTGGNCSEISCIENNNCSQHGICVEPNLCQCDVGYTGSDCVEFSCEDLNFCSGQGSCVGLDACLCDEGYSGSECDIPNCSNISDCNQQGQCISYNVCECYEGFDGEDCQDLLSPNTGTPMFPQSMFNSTVPENTPAGTDIIMVYANDSDSGRNGQVRYNLIDGGDQFVVDGETGIISTRVVFDYESDINVYQLAIVAEDKGSPVMSSTATVLMMISDENDNCPVVNNVEVEVDILTDVEPGTVLATIFADDADEGNNGRITYDFYQVSDKIRNLFEIDAVNGIISTKTSVTAGRHVIRVLASDMSVSPCGTEIEVVIDVLPAPTTESPTTESPTTQTPTRDPSSSPSQSTYIATMSIITSPSGDCDGDNDCENNGVCIKHQCRCPCQFTGRRCELGARCYDFSMIVEAVRGVPFDFTPGLSDPDSEEYTQTVDMIQPLIDDILYSTETAANEYISADITMFTEGSLVVHYTITLAESTTMSNIQLGSEIEAALNNNEDISVKEDSLVVKAATFSWKMTDYSVYEFDGSTTLTIERTGYLGRTSSIAVSTVDMSAVSNGNDPDYNEYTSTIQFDEEESEKPVTIVIQNDDELELNPETFKVVLSEVVNGHIDGSTEAIVTIIDDESTYEMKLDSYIVAEIDKSVDVYVTRTGYKGIEGSVTLQLSSGSAFSGTDYTESQPRIMFATGQSEGFATIEIKEDEEEEDDEMFVVSLLSSASGFIVHPMEAEVTIVNSVPDTSGQGTVPPSGGDGDGGDQSVPPSGGDGDGGDQSGSDGSGGSVGNGGGTDHTGSTFAFMPTEYRVYESDLKATVVIIRTGDTSVAGSVRFNTVNGDAKVNEDFQRVDIRVNFAPDQMTEMVEVKITDDNEVELVETFVVMLSDPEAGTVQGPTNMARISIVDDDSAVVFEYSRYTTNEGVGSVIVAVLRVGNAEGSASVEILAVGDDGAISGSDFVFTPTTVTFEHGSSKQFVSITILDDDVMELTEAIKCVLSNPRGTELGILRETRISVEDDDDVPGERDGDTDDGDSDDSDESPANPSTISGPLIGITVGVIMVIVIIIAAITLISAIVIKNRRAKLATRSWQAPSDEQKMYMDNFILMHRRQGNSGAHAYNMYSGPGCVPDGFSGYYDYGRQQVNTYF